MPYFFEVTSQIIIFLFTSLQLINRVHNRPGRLFPIVPLVSWLTKIHLEVPKNKISMTPAQNRRSAAGFPDLGIFGKCPRFICRKSTIYKGLLSKKKSWSHGTTLGWLGDPISKGFMQKNFCYFFNAQNMPKWHIFKGYGHRGYSFKVRKQQLRSKYCKTRWRDVKSYLVQN